MDKNYKQIEKLNCIRNEMTHLWGSVFIIGGSSISFMIASNSFKARFIGIIGIVAALMLVYAYFIRREETIKIVDNLKEE